MLYQTPMTLNALLPFAGSGLNMHEDKRSTGEITAYLQDPKARTVLLHKGQPALRPDFTLLTLPPSEADQFPHFEPGPLFLGVDEIGPVFGVSVKAVTHPLSEEDFQPLRMVGGRLPARDLAIAGYARSMFDWHYNHPFCAKCGQVSEMRQGGIKRVCNSCQTEHFPRVNPVAIMLPIFEDKCLIGRGPNWPPGYFSALAGFVSPGESLEECCIREVSEEVGLVVRNPRYIFSQPWPFPSQLMMGLLCEADSQEITLNTAELSEAKWVSRAEVQAVFDKQSQAFMLPPKVAIAYHLFKYWLEESA